MNWLFRWMALALAISAVPYVVSGVVVRDFPAAMLAAAILAVLNAVVKPVLVLLTLPLTFFSLGLFLLVINAFLFQFAGGLVTGVQISSFWSALGASLFVSVVSGVLNMFGDNRVVFRVQRGVPTHLRTKQRNSGSAPGTRKLDGTVELHQTDDGKWE